ncbi:hypothetical protein FSP39_003335 [Pinctada imbricata]|uniref:Activator of basal transcription 1 n=1 Tax=Pinctada imbricata TaxID=66713 RepID=A0AA88XKW4_PINIB|nr:hypothetical protein FSP39_003335 [Pinctada imbricata]
MENNVPEEQVPVKTTKKHVKPGVIYLSRVPPLMTVKKIRDIFCDFDEIGRIFLQPDERAAHGKKGRSFTEGWVEFGDKRKAKMVAMKLNNTTIGGKKKSRWYDELWNIKYLHRFQWAHLNERLAYEKAVHKQRLRTEISQVKREANFHIRNSEKRRKKTSEKEKKTSEKEQIMSEKEKSGEEDNVTIPKEKEEKNYEFKQKETEDEILKKKKAKFSISKIKKDKKRLQEKKKNNKKTLTSRSSFLKNIFSGGGEVESMDDDL